MSFQWIPYWDEDYLTSVTNTELYTMRMYKVWNELVEKYFDGKTTKYSFSFTNKKSFWNTKWPAMMEDIASKFATYNPIDTDPGYFISFHFETWKNESIIDKIAYAIPGGRSRSGIGYPSLSYIFDKSVEKVYPSFMSVVDTYVPKKYKTLDMQFHRLNELWNNTIKSWAKRNSCREEEYWTDFYNWYRTPVSDLQFVNHLYRSKAYIKEKMGLTIPEFLEYAKRLQEGDVDVIA